MRMHTSENAEPAMHTSENAEPAVNTSENAEPAVNTSENAEPAMNTSENAETTNTQLIEWLDARMAAIDARAEARHKELEKKIECSQDFTDYLKRMCRYLFGILNKVLDNSAGGVSPAPCITVD